MLITGYFMEHFSEISPNFYIYWYFKVYKEDLEVVEYKFLNGGETQYL